MAESTVGQTAWLAVVRDRYLHDPNFHAMVEYVVRERRLADPVTAAAERLAIAVAALQEAQERGDRYEAALERIKSHLEAEDRELAALIPGERDWVAREVIRPGLDIARAALQGDTNR